MPLIPLLFGDDLYTRPSRILDQHFGHGLDPEDLLAPYTVPHGRLARTTSGYYRPWRSMISKNDTGSTISLQKDKFQINLDVQQFAPEEITVKVVDKRNVIIEGKHEEKEDEHGFISRQFSRRYILPETYDVEQLQSNLSSDGVLTITAPKAASDGQQHRTIPITHTGKPSKLTANNGQENVPNDKGDN